MNRLHWRCRRGMREMDILLGGFLQNQYPQLPPPQQQAFAELLEEIDQDILDWVMARRPVPERYAEIVQLITNARS